MIFWRDDLPNFYKQPLIKQLNLKWKSWLQPNQPLSCFYGEQGLVQILVTKVSSLGAISLCLKLISNSLIAFKFSSSIRELAGTNKTVKFRNGWLMAEGDSLGWPTPQESGEFEWEIFHNHTCLKVRTLKGHPLTIPWILFYILHRTHAVSILIKKTPTQYFMLARPALDFLITNELCRKNNGNFKNWSFLDSFCL